MTDKEQTRIFQKNLLKYLELTGKSQKEVADAIGVQHQTFSAWCCGIAFPRMGKVQALADYFHIKKSDLIESHDFDLSDKAREVFVEAEKLPPEQLDNLLAYIRFLQSQT